MKSVLSSVALAAAALVTAAPSAAAIVVNFVASATQVNVGDFVTVDMNISGLGNEILRSFDINMLFDPGVLDNFSVTHMVALQWPGGGIFGPSIFGAGNTKVVDIAFDDDATLAASQANDFVVLRFGFTAIADGSSFVDLGLDANSERRFGGINNAALSVDVEGVCIAVGTGSCPSVGIPEPASYGLAAVALLATGIAGRTRRGVRKLTA